MLKRIWWRIRCWWIDYCPKHFEALEFAACGYSGDVWSWCETCQMERRQLAQAHLDRMKSEFEAMQVNLHHEIGTGQSAALSEREVE